MIAFNWNVPLKIERTKTQPEAPVQQHIHHDLLSGRQLSCLTVKLRGAVRAHVFLTECDSIRLPIPLENTTRLTTRMQPRSLRDRSSTRGACWNSAGQITANIFNILRAVLKRVWRNSIKLSGKILCLRLERAGRGKPYSGAVQYRRLYSNSNINSMSQSAER